MLPRITATAVFAAALTSPNAASAAGVAYAATGDIDVAPDLGACATVVLDRPATAAGTFSAAGVAAGPGSVVGAVRGAVPILLNNERHWYGCVPGAHPGAVVGEATYVLSLSSGEADYVRTVSCSVRSGAVSCS